MYSSCAAAHSKPADDPAVFFFYFSEKRVLRAIAGLIRGERERGVADFSTEG